MPKVNKKLPRAARGASKRGRVRPRWTKSEIAILKRLYRTLDLHCRSLRPVRCVRSTVIHPPDEGKRCDSKLVESPSLVVINYLYEGHGHIIHCCLNGTVSRQCLCLNKLDLCLRAVHRMGHGNRLELDANDQRGILEEEGRHTQSGRINGQTGRQSHPYSLVRRMDLDAIEQASSQLEDAGVLLHSLLP